MPEAKTEEGPPAKQAKPEKGPAAKQAKMAFGAKQAKQAKKTTAPPALGKLSYFPASGKCLFGQMPILETAEGVVIGQYIFGSGDADLAKFQMCFAEGEDIYALLLGAGCSGGSAEARGAKAVDQAELFAELLPAHVAYLEALCSAGGGFTSTGATCGELYLVGMLLQVTLAAPAGGAILDAHPKLKAWFTTTMARPGVKSVLEGKSAIGKMDAYFVTDKEFATIKAVAQACLTSHRERYSDAAS
ncbi:hypothetical protein T492DRAFT_874277 [Pavlovales sp. CCMP2436]|nr:hypothetical protein T492DRAFT_874277 [Pavlovales sp. CCMP2436]